MGHSELVALLEAFGASGVATLLTGVISAKLSGAKQNQAEPNGARHRLSDEVIWLRQQVAMYQAADAIKKATDTIKKTTDD